MRQSGLGKFIAFRLGFISLCLAVGSLLATAQVVGGVDFGSAGPNYWGVLALGGSQTAGFGNQGTSVQFAGAPPYGGILGSFASVGITGPGSLQASSVEINGSYYKGSNTGHDSISNTLIGGDILAGPDIDSALQDATSAAASGLAAANSLTCNMGPLCNTALTSSMTIEPVNPGGQNVLIVSSINLGNHVSVTLDGPAGTDWVVIVSRNMTLNSAMITIAPALTTSNVLIVVNGSVSTSGGLNNECVLNGLLVVPTGTIHFSPGLIYGEVITGGNQAAFASGASVVTPHPMPQ
jgi:hypothetical protein